MASEDIFSLGDLESFLDQADNAQNLAKAEEIPKGEGEGEIKDFDFSMNSPTMENPNEMTNLDFLSRMMSKNLRGYFKGNYSWLVKKFSRDILDTFMGICDKLGDEDVETDVFDIVLKDMGVTDVRHDIILSNFEKVKQDRSGVIEKSTYERFREIVYKAYFDSVNNGNAVETLEKIQSSEFFLPPYGIIESETFKQVDFGDIDVDSIVEDLGAPLYSHFKEINDVSPIHGYIPSQVTMIAAPPSCFVGSTKVRTPEGIKTLYELNQDHRPSSVMYTNLNDGKVDWTWDNKGCQMTGSSKELIKIFVTTQPDFPIVCTLDHKFLVINLAKGFEWVEAQNLKYGDILMSNPMKECVKVLHTEVATYNKEIPLYDIVDNGEYHNYFINVGHEDICVHNCFTGDTKVILEDGTVKTMKELSESSESINVPSYSMYNSRVEYMHADECRLMREANELCKLTFEDGSYLKCTPDHMFPLSKGMIFRADELREGDEIPIFNLQNTNFKQGIQPMDVGICERLVKEAARMKTYKISRLSKSLKIPYHILKSTISYYFGDLHGFAHSAGLTFRENIHKVDIRKSDALKFRFDGASFTELMVEFDTDRESVEKAINKYKISLPDCPKMSEETIKVKSVEIIRLEKPEPVYDVIDVQVNHNFMVIPEGSDKGIVALQSGKTLFMMTEAVEALRQGKKVLYAAIGDLKKFDFVSRMCSIVMKIPMSKTAMNIKNTYAMMCKLFPYFKKNLKIQFMSPNKYTADEWYKMIDQMGLIDEYDVFFIDYDTNFASEKDSMYAKGDEVYTMAYRLSQRPGKYVFIASQPKVGTWKDQELGLESASESSRKQQIVDVMITISHDRDVKNPKNHIGIINIPKNRRGGNTSFSYFLDPTGIMMSITPEGKKAIKEDSEAVSVVQTEYWDKSTHLLPNAAANQDSLPQQNLIMIGDDSAE